jgi:hypothetical protein
LICDNDLNALIITGNPPANILEAARLSLMTEFSQLSGGDHASAVNEVLKDIHLYKLQIDSLYICIELLKFNRIESATDYLKSQNIAVSGDIDEIAKRIVSMIKSKSIYLDKEISKYGKLTSDVGNNDRKIDAEFYNDQLAVLSVHFKFNIDMNITLARYASYLKIFNESVRHVKN